MFDKLKEKLSGPFSSGEDRGVSPVIGVILMVAITVILAAVIGAFVLGLGGDLESSASPTMSASVSANSDYNGDTDTEALYISHSNGDEIEAGDLRVIVRDADGAEVASFEESSWSGVSAEADAATLTIGGSAPGPDNGFEAGSTITITDDNTDTTAGNLAFDTSKEYTVQIVHRGSGATVSEGTASF